MEQFCIKVFQFICGIGGHKLRMVAYKTPKYDVYVCSKCGKVVKKVRAGGAKR